MLLVVLLAGCQKKGSGRIDILLVERYTLKTDTSVNPYIQTISDPVVSDIPLVANEDIRSYSSVHHRFQLSRDIRARLESFGPDKGFVVMADGQPVYYGSFHPAYMSSIRIGIATIDATKVIDNQLSIDFFLPDNAPAIAALDKRNDPRLLRALRESGRLR